MVLPQFQYKDRLDLSDRLAIAQTYVRFEGHHGLVTELAADYQTNLKQIYAILRDVERCDSTLKPFGGRPWIGRSPKTGA